MRFGNARDSFPTKTESSAKNVCRSQRAVATLNERFTLGGTGCFRDSRFGLFGPLTALSGPWFGHKPLHFVSSGRCHGTGATRFGLPAPRLGRGWNRHDGVAEVRDI